jgi:hypothetical protein
MIANSGWNPETERFKFIFLGEEHKLTVEIDGRPDFHKGLGPNMIHSVDGFIVREMVRRCSYDRDRVTNITMDITKGEKFSCGREDKFKMVRVLWKHYQKTDFLSVRILDYLDSETLQTIDKLLIAKLLASMPEHPFDMVTVHDCFRTHANYGNDVRRQYNIIMADINDSRMLTSLCSQIANKNLTARKVGKIDRDDILNGNYLLT